MRCIVIKPTDHKLHVRVPTLNKFYHHKMLNACRRVGITISSVTPNYTNYYVFIPNSVDRHEAQAELIRVLSQILILV